MKILTLLPLLLLAAPRAADERPDIFFAVADDWAYPHAGIYGDKVVKTPTFDRVAKEGVLFTHGFCASPSCTPSRAAILTGQYIHRMEDSGNLWSQLNALTDLLALVNVSFRLKEEISRTAYPYDSLALKEVVVNALVHR